MEFNLLADESVDFRIVKYLREKKIDVFSILENQPGITDEQVISLAKEKNSVLLTEDSDFGEFVFSFQEKAISVIFLRYNTRYIEDIKLAILKILDKYQHELYGKFIVITPNKVRIREIFS